jgi:hypothetical protein
VKVQNVTNSDYFLVFQKIFEFKKFFAIATTKSEAKNLKRLFEMERPGEKFLIVRIKKKEVKRI